MPDTSEEPAPVGNPIASPCKPIPKYRRGEGVALDERTGQATQIEAQLYHNSSGQRPKSRGEQAGNDTGGKREQERTNRTHNPDRSPTLPQQHRPKTQKPRRASGRRTRRQARTRTNRNGHERTKAQGSPDPKKKRAPRELRHSQARVSH